MPRRTTIFVSYCHRNRRWVQRLRVHLTPYDRLGVLDLWDDTKSSSQSTKSHGWAGNEKDRQSTDFYDDGATFVVTDIR